ncbi:hypothetical protein HPB50_002306 [Hyalomma asiaticum]|uniref:Uncharacterized protein n=1 Tax=Hyalomma asiaticum TaxID=266040 RepID=A0ACB7SK40_HYAAI|nr:hypothetical protein HPB50_002306 [Hyalomma asiaticum]
MSMMGKKNKVPRPAEIKLPTSSRSREAPGNAAGTTQGVMNRDEGVKSWVPPSPGGPRRGSRCAGSVEMARRRTQSGQTVLSDDVIERLRSLLRVKPKQVLDRNAASLCGNVRQRIHSSHVSERRRRWKEVHGRSPRTELLLRHTARCKTLLLIVALGAAVLLALFVAYLVFRPSPVSEEQPRTAVCQSAACGLLVSSVLSQLNRSVDPCSDIQAHVCSRVKWDSHLTTDTATDMIRQWHRRGALFLHTKRRPEAAYFLYRACMDPDPNGVSQLKAFMRERGLLWPEYGSTGRHALYVVFDLLINWGVPFWFEMSLRQLPNDSRYSIYFTYVRTMDTWKRRQQVSADAGFLKDYANGLYTVFGASQAARSHIPRLLKLEAAMHDIIVSPETRDKSDSFDLFLPSAPIYMLSAFTSNISTETWLSYLNELLSPHRFQADDKVLVDDLDLPRSMEALFGNYSNEDMLYTLGWWFAQRYIVMASRDGGLASYGSEVVAQTNRPIDCYAIAESRFRRELFHERAQASLGTAGLRQATELLAKIRNTTVAMVRSLSWFDEDARNQAAFLVRTLQLEPWTSEFHLKTARLPSVPLLPTDDSTVNQNPREAARVFSRVAAASLRTGLFEPQRTAVSFPKDAREQGQMGKYSSGSWSKGVDSATFLARRPYDGRRLKEPRNDKRSFSADHQPAIPYFSTAVTGWIKAATDYKETFPNWPLDDSLLHRHLSTALLAQYDYWWNSVFLQMGAFAEPLFYEDASMSANYGGLGFLVAKNLFKSFDYKRGSRLDASRQYRDWMSPDSRASYDRKVACTGGDAEVLAHVAALEIASAAFFDSAAETRIEEEGPPEGHLLPGQGETLSPEMVFFLAYCRGTCGARLGCGEVLKRVKRFGLAFQCPENSSMTSLPSCTFFGN